MSDILTCLVIGVIGMSLARICAGEKKSVQRVKTPQPRKIHSRLYYAPFSVN